MTEDQADDVFAMIDQLYELLDTLCEGLDEIYLQDESLGPTLTHLKDARSLLAKAKDRIP